MQVEPFHMFYQLCIDCLITLVQRVAQKLVNHREASFLLQQPGCTAQVTRGRRGIRKRPCVFINAQQEQSRFQRSEANA